MSISEASYDQALSIIAEMSLTDMSRINSELAALIKKQCGGVSKSVKKEKKEKDPDAPKRKAATGTLAWMAFVKDRKRTMSERFTECTKEPERLSVCKAIKEEDKEAYDAFVATFKAEHSDAASVVSDASASASEAKVAVLKAAIEAKKSKPASKPVEVKEAEVKEVKKAEPKKAEVKKAEPKPKEVKKAEPKPKEAKKTEAKKTEAKKPEPKVEVQEVQEVQEEESPMQKKTIDDTTYFFDPSTNGLWQIEGAWVGYWMGEGAEEEIRYTESMEEADE